MQGEIKEFVAGNRAGIIFTALLLLAASGAYFYMGAAGGMGSGGALSAGADIYRGMRLKAAYSGEGGLQIYALARNNQLAKLAPSGGNPIPEERSMVLGAGEAEAMKKREEISGVGSRAGGLPGINATVEGILQRTGQPLDNFRFLSAGQFAKIDGRGNEIFVRLDGKREPTVFFVINASNAPADSGDPGSAGLPFSAKFAEGRAGSLASFSDEDGEKTCPVVLGADRASAMRAEKAFSAVGDRIVEFFGNSVEVRGVLSKTNSSIDMLNFVGSDCNYQ